MDILQAKDLLLKHSFQHEDLAHPKMETGFLGSLRPYSGLSEDNFHEVMEIIAVLAPELENKPNIDSQLISALWGICHFSNAWALEPEGMLQRNDLIAESDIDRLSNWVNIISYAVFMLLDGGGLEHAMEPYESYKRDFL